MNLGIKGKKVLVTGGSHGIGRSIALALAEEGCDVAICARDGRKLNAVFNEIAARGVLAMAVPADAAKLSEIQNVFETVIGAWGTIHILINNVGGGGRWGSEIVEETAEEVWSEVYNKNALAAVRFTMKVLPFMRAKKWGRVITVASRIGKEAGGRPWFTMAKAGEIALMKELSRKSYLVRDGITFNSVAPGAIMIPDTGWEAEAKKNPKKFKKMLDKEFPSGRLGTPEEVAYAVAFLCSMQASHINGSCLAVDGGESLSF